MNMRDRALLHVIAGGSSAAAPATETKTVSLALANGNQIVTPTDGKLLSEVTIEKPVNLLPENIAEGVDIAGVIGALAVGGGGSSMKIAYGTFAGNDGNVTVEHGLGVVPDIIVVFGGNASKPSTSNISAIMTAVGFSQPIIDSLVTLGANVGQVSALQKKSGSSYLAEQSVSNKSRVFTKDQPLSCALRSATESSFTVGYYDTSAGVWLPGTGIAYQWIAIGGLT